MSFLVEAGKFAITAAKYGGVVWVAGSIFDAVDLAPKARASEVDSSLPLKITDQEYSDALTEEAKYKSRTDVSPREARLQASYGEIAEIGATERVERATKTDEIAQRDQISLDRITEPRLGTRGNRELVGGAAGVTVSALGFGLEWLRRRKNQNRQPALVVVPLSPVRP